MKTILATAAALLTLSAANVQASTTKLLAFGDSLVDGGNRQALTLGAGFDWPSDIYPNGQFTNGDAWSTQLGLRPSLLGGTNYAVGGAKALTDDDPWDDLRKQIRDFYQQARATDMNIHKNVAATIWAGGNDLLALPADQSQRTTERQLKQVVKRIAWGVQKLYDTGVKTIVVFGLPDLGILPEAAVDPARAAGATAIANAYNTALEQTLAGLNLALPDANVEFFDVDSIFQQVVSQVPPELISVPCLADPAGCAANPGNYLLYDNIHPSEWVHTAIAEELDARLDINLSEVPLPGAAPLLLAGLGGMALWGRRRKANA